MIKVEFSPEALVDARETRRWYAERSVTAGERFEAELRRTIDLAALLPQAGSLGPGETRRLRLHGFPHSLIYRAGPSVLVVLAIAHERREPGYWRKD